MGELSLNIEKSGFRPNSDFSYQATDITVPIVVASQVQGDPLAGVRLSRLRG
jgi:hypothetical protein